ncbi:MAG: serine hydrolase [Anaerolineae bacterium]|nr:serine hydrolase [Anaerolineae bacterium]
MADGQDPLQHIAARVLAPETHFDSLLVRQGGVTLLDAYRFPYGPDLLHDQRSVCKSVVALLVGIAIERGYLESVDQPVLPFFADYNIVHLDDQKQAITIRDLLTMRSGLDLTDAMTGEMRGSDNWVGYVLDRPMRADPGTRFEYATGNVHLLAAIIGRASGWASGPSTRAFAERYLFGPLGITIYRWDEDPQGVATGGMGLYLTPHDMAKLGQLVLDGGRWAGQQIVSSAWVAACASPQVKLEGETDYGYLWWVHRNEDEAEFYVAHGYAGQHICALPELDAVVVLTGRLKPDELGVTERLLADVIRPALAAARATALPAADAAPSTVFDAPPAPVPPLPEVARRISGRAIRVEPNVFGWETLVFTFADGADEATVTVNDHAPARIGLDGVWRLMPDGWFIHWDAETLPVALYGRWTRDDSLALAYQEVGVPEGQDLTLTFTGNRVEVVAVETLSGETERLVGEW